MTLEKCRQQICRSEFTAATRVTAPGSDGIGSLAWSAPDAEGSLLVRFDADIRPLFRPEDVEEMSWAFDLATYEDVKANAEVMHERLAGGSMPCDGPWDQKQVRRFRDWIDWGAPA